MNEETDRRLREALDAVETNFEASRTTIEDVAWEQGWSSEDKEAAILAWEDERLKARQGAILRVL